MKNYEYTILPEYAPLYPKLPYHYKGFEKVSVFCRADVDKLKRHIPKEFELTSDIFEVFVLKNNEIDGLKPYSEGGIVIPCKYNGIEGATVAYEYVTTDDALCAGREIWGYPKKLAEVSFEREGKSIKATCSRDGGKLINISFHEDDTKNFEIPTFSPRLQVKRMTHPEKLETDVNFIIKNELENPETKLSVNGNAELEIRGNSADPLDQLGFKGIIGSNYSEGTFTLTYGKVLKDLNK